jgi:hypothetical protein
MAKLASRILTMAVVVVMASMIVLGSNRKDTVTFSRDIMVNGTLVKAGTYNIKYDEKSNELSVMKDKKVIATAAGHLEDLQKKANDTTFTSTSKDNTDVLVGVTFGGDNHRILIGEGDGQASK